MNIRHYSFSIKNIFYDKIGLRLFYFDKAKSSQVNHPSMYNFGLNLRLYIANQSLKPRTV